MHMPLVLTNRRRRGGSASAPAFSPTSLFSTTAIGIWLDPSDLSTMFSDRAGTTPVTTPGTVVGLRLDKSKGGEQSLPTTGWTVNSGDGVVTIADNVITITGATTTTRVDINSPGWVIGDYAKITVNASIGSATGATIFVGGGAPSGVSAGSRTYVAVISSSTLTRVQISSGSATFTVAARSKNPGNHAVAPTDAARPVYGIEPKGGRRNLLTFSEDYSNAIWTKSGTTATAGVLTESSASDFHGASQSFTYLTADYTFAVDFKPNGRDWVVIQARNNFSYFGLTGAGSLGTTGGTITSRSITLLPDGYYRCVITIPVTAGNNNVTIYLASANGTVSYTGNGTSGVFLRNAQLELGSTATAYQRVLSAYDVTESGVATTHYVQYDGSDDSMSTAAIDFTATDKMSVFAGVRKLSSASSVIVDLSTNPDTTNGVIAMSNKAINTYLWRSRGTANGDAQPGGTYIQPISNVLTGLGDISGDTATFRIDGTQVAQATTDQGTGNYGNYPMFFGRRNNASLPFNGRDFGIIIVGKAASGTEITDTETWLAAKTAQVTL